MMKTRFPKRTGMVKSPTYSSVHPVYSHFEEIAIGVEIYTHSRLNQPPHALRFGPGFWVESKPLLPLNHKGLSWKSLFLYHSYSEVR